jgi:hypothetical protein
MYYSAQLLAVLSTSTPDKRAPNTTSNAHLASRDVSLAGSPARLVLLCLSQLTYPLPAACACVDAVVFVNVTSPILLVRPSVFLPPVEVVARYAINPHRLLVCLFFVGRSRHSSAHRQHVPARRLFVRAAPGRQPGARHTHHQPRRVLLPAPLGGGLEDQVACQVRGTTDP